MALKPYHHVWLSTHPHRSAEWLTEHLAEGFDVHHINGDHSDDAPENLVLIECADHMALHGKPNFLRTALRPPSKRIVIQRYASGRHHKQGRSIVAEFYEQIERGEIDGSKKPDGYPLPVLFDVDNFTGPEVRKWRRAMGLTVAEASELLGFQPVTFTRWEKEGMKRSVALACLSISYGIPPYHEGMDLAAISMGIPEERG